MYIYTLSHLNQGQKRLERIDSIDKSTQKNYTKAFYKNVYMNLNLKERDMFYQIEKEKICIPAASKRSNGTSKRERKKNISIHNKFY